MKKSSLLSALICLSIGGNLLAEKPTSKAIGGVTGWIIGEDKSTIRRFSDASFRYYNGINRICGGVSFGVMGVAVGSLGIVAREPLALIAGLALVGLSVPFISAGFDGMRIKEFFEPSSNELEEQVEKDLLEREKPNNSEDSI